MSRWIRFLIAIIIGASLGLTYGWFINPVEYVDTAPDTLRVDYKTDFILMVAEAYQGESDLGLAVRRLGLLGDTDPPEIVYQAILFGQKAGYADVDLELMQSLMSALETYTPSEETPGP